MKTNKEYQVEVEKKYGKPLKVIMHELIVECGMDQWDGSTKLGVPKETFIVWRTKFRLGPDQRRADLAEQMRNKTHQEYKEELVNVDLKRPFEYKIEKSLRGFKEVIERMVELEKQRRVLSDIGAIGDISHMMRIATLESIVSYLDQYDLSELHKTFEHDVEHLKTIMRRESRWIIS
ncbi:hypothetical protein ACFQZE_08340 [Paenibacillus sp. GCM10027627]|uniref:hypothetical protein n=1 Tax=unclassified Paenibacillus TaxID=185978 RepID=UPI00362B22D9